MDKLIKLKEYLLGYIYCLIGTWKRIIPNRIIFFTFQGSYVCNPKYICEALRHGDQDMELIWVSLSKEAKFPDGIHVVQLGTKEYYESIYSARVLIENAFNYTKRPFRKRKGQLMIQTMHGSLGIKKLIPRKAGLKSARNTDVIISNSEFEDKVYRTSYWMNTRILRIGHARTDILFGTEEQKKETCNKVRSFFGLDENVKMCMYAPTFLRYNTTRYESIDYKRLCDSLHVRFGGEWVVIRRLHPRNLKDTDSDFASEYVIDGGMYDDIQELMVAIDFGITDYSSWIYDYVLTGKPGAIFAPDIKEYNSAVGFYYPIEDTPFIIAASNEELSKKIEVFSMEEYTNKVESFIADKNCVDDGLSSKRAVNAIMNINKGQSKL